MIIEMFGFFACALGVALLCNWVFGKVLDAHNDSMAFILKQSHEDRKSRESMNDRLLAVIDDMTARQEQLNARIYERAGLSAQAVIPSSSGGGDEARIPVRPYDPYTPRIPEVEDEGFVDAPEDMRLEDSKRADLGMSDDDLHALRESLQRVSKGDEALASTVDGPSDNDLS